MAERSESPSRNGLSHIWSKTRSRDKKNRDSASNSVKSTDSENHLSVRESLESTIDKIKGDEDGDSNGLKKLVPKGLGSKRRRKKQEQEEEQRASEEAARGRSVAERGTLENDAAGSFEDRNRSRDGSSLITYDSDTES
jgi:hypothetical protein